MALAATLAAGGLRPASFLPAIKCSSCGDEIEIAAMGDHACQKAPPSPNSQPASLSNPFTLRQMNAHGHLPHAPSPLQQQSKPTALPKTRVRAPTLTSSKSLPAPRPVRPAPPSINPEAANMPFLAPRPPRSQSPISPALSARSGSSNGSRPPPIRSQTSPMPRLFDPRPPSPELSANLDCAFPPFPTSSSTGSGSRPGTSNGRKTPTPSERAPSRGGSRQSGRRPSEPFAFEPQPRSPLSSAGDTGRTDTLKSGSFDPSRRRPSDQGSIPQQPLDRRRPSLSSIKLSHEPPPLPTEPIPRPPTSHMNNSQIPRPSTASGQKAQAAPQPIQKKEPPRRPERPAEEMILPQFSDQMSAEPIVEMPSIFSPSQPPVPLRSADRSRTFPVRQESSDETMSSHTLHKTPSEPQLRGRDRRPTLTAQSRSEASQIPQAPSRQRSQSRSGPRMDPRLQDAPPVPRPVQQHRQEKTHNSSASGSSTASSAASMGNSNSSSGPSPVGSAASSIDAFSPLSYETVQYAEDAGMRVAGLNVKASQKPGERAEQPAQRSPPRNFARPSPPKQIALPAPRTPDLSSVVSPPLESPMDPMMQAVRSPSTVGQQRPTLSRTRTSPESGQRGPSPSLAPLMPPSSAPPSGQQEYDPYRAPSPQPPTRSRSKSTASQYSAYSVASEAPPLPKVTTPQTKASNPGTALRSQSPQAIPAPPPVPQQIPRVVLPTRRSTSARAVCRGCHLQIEGKSVKAADGRLTGRWHKACFTCRTCEEPFTTADFYVIANHPYCEQHYHEANGSLCHGCNRGIEGQYLETTSSSVTGNGDKKFHPRCFTCHECREVLSDDYFEIASKVYCERHALAAMRGQARIAGPGTFNPLDRRALTAERRTTKLMMM